MSTPIEQAQAALDGFLAEVNRLEREQHQLDRERAAARLVGDDAALERIHEAFHQSNVDIRLAQGRAADARERVSRAQNDLNQTRDRLVETGRAVQRLDSEITDLRQHLASLQNQREVAQVAADDAQRALAALEPPAEPTAAPAVPTPAVEPEPHPAPAYPPYTSAMHYRGEPSRYFRDGIEVDASGRPLDQQPEPKPEAPRRKRDGQVETAPSLFD